MIEDGVHPGPPVDESVCQAGRHVRNVLIGWDAPCPGSVFARILFHDDGAPVGYFGFCEEHFGFLRGQVEMDVLIPGSE